MRSVISWLLLCCIYQPVSAQYETIITVDISMTFIERDRLEEQEVTQGYFRCYKEYIVEKIRKIDMKKIKTPADIKPPFYNDSSYYLINTALQKFVSFDALSAAAKPTAADDLAEKPLGLKMENVALLDSASRIADTTIAGIQYIRYRAFKQRKTKSTLMVITGYLLPVPNTTPYSYHRKTELEVQGRFAWVDIRDIESSNPYNTIRFQYETRKIPAKEWKVIDGWISRTKW